MSRVQATKSSNLADKQMKIIVTGSRSIQKYSVVSDAIISSHFYKNENIEEIVSGTDIGVDKLGEYWADIYNISVKRFPAKWEDTENKPEKEIRYGKYGPYWIKAGIVRNAEMADYADGLILVWDGKSRRSKNMVQEMIKRNKPTFVYSYKDGKVIKKYHRG